MKQIKMMNLWFLLIVLLVALTTVSCNPFAASEGKSMTDDMRNPQIRITNNTGQSISAVHARMAGTSQWRHDISRSVTMPHGSTHYFSAPYPLNVNRHYDILFSAGRESWMPQDVPIITKNNIDASNGISIAVSSADMPPSITITNNTNESIHEIWIRATGTNEWIQRWRSSSSSLPNGSSQTILALQPLRDNDRYDIQLRRVDHGVNRLFTKSNELISNGTTVTFTRADLCDSFQPTIIIANNTNERINNISVRVAGETEWRSLSTSTAWFNHNTTQSVVLPHPLNEHNRYDIQLRRVEGGVNRLFTKHNELISNGTTITFTSSDFCDSNRPTIIIANNTNESIGNISVRVTGETEWVSLWTGGWLQHNATRDVMLPHPLNEHSRYDIQLRRVEGGVNRLFTKHNELISNGTTVTFTSSDFCDSNRPTIIIANNTNERISNISVRVAGETEWRSLWTSSGWQADLQHNATQNVVLPHPVGEHNKYDIQLRRVEGGVNRLFTKSNELISDGITITFTSSDFCDSNRPTIIIANNTNERINNISVRVAGETEWVSLWTSSAWVDLQHNATQSVLLPHPLNEHNRYDIQLRRVEQPCCCNGWTGANRLFTKTNELVSNGTTITFTSADTHPQVSVSNNTGEHINRIRIRKAGTTEWIYENSLSISSGSSHVISMPYHISEHRVYDIQLSSWSTFTKLDITVTSGMQLPFTSSDRDPSMIISNQTGFTINGIWLRIPGSTDWRYRVYEGDVWNTNNAYVNLPYQLDVQNRYDIQLRTSTGIRYTKLNNAVYDEIQVIFTSADLGDR